MNTLVSKNMNPVVGSLNLLEGVAMYNAEIRETLEIGYGCPGLYDWWMAEEAHSLALDLNGEHRYQLRLPPADNGEAFFVAGLTEFRRPEVVASEEAVKKKCDIYKRNGDERLAKRESLLLKKRIRTRASRAAGAPSITMPIGFPSSSCVPILHATSFDKEVVGLLLGRHKCCQWARLTCDTHPDIDISEQWCW
ncbi:hypothetical protein CYMTET_5431 [Cymbomonas tetramitiformis]|uniref:Uncharacterized protein n=1 Tax=Cymbomonas tetramitiformis TaxID=36881 RepID=A0AAE0GZJ7_9CHLO|nr:hypothetical protein CYMTET_5431 [Cymbomonas tetramitiformis]